MVLNNHLSYLQLLFFNIPAIATAMAAPLECRDMRSTSLPFKRDRDHNAKWAHGARPSAGVRRDICAPLDDPNGGLIGGNEGQRAKVRPYKQHSQL